MKMHPWLILNARFETLLGKINYYYYYFNFPFYIFVSFFACEGSDFADGCRELNKSLNLSHHAAFKRMLVIINKQNPV
jgi:hypothetical protein